MTGPPIIGVVMWALGGYFWGGIFAGIQQAARQRGAQILVFRGLPRDLATTPFARDLVQGWIVIYHLDDLARLARTGVPIVTVSAIAPELNCPAVLSDNVGSMRAAVEHLIA